MIALLCASLAVHGAGEVAAANFLTYGDVLVGDADSPYVHAYAPNGTSKWTAQPLNGGYSQELGMCFLNGSQVVTTNWFGNNESLISSDGTVVQPFASIQLPESCSVDSRNDVILGSETALTRLNSTGNVLATYPIPHELARMALGPDQCTVYYTQFDQSVVSRFDVCSSAALSDFATGLPGGPCWGVTAFAAGGLLVACDSDVVHLDSSGNVLATYAAGTFGDPSSPSGYALDGVDLTSDESAFWVDDANNFQVTEVSLASGGALTSFQNQALGGGLAVFTARNIPGPAISLTTYVSATITSSDPVTTQEPQVVQSFGAVAFDPRTADAHCSNPSSLGPNSRPWTNSVPQVDGTCTHQVVRPPQDTNHQVGVSPAMPQCNTSAFGDYSGFSAVFEGQLATSAAGLATVAITAAGRWRLGFLQQSASPADPAGNVLSDHTIDKGYPVYGESAGTAPTITTTALSITFASASPASYAYELDYTAPTDSNCANDPLTLVLSDGHGHPFAMREQGRPRYVAIGDSITAGYSIAGCQADLLYSPFNCIGSVPTVTTQCGPLHGCTAPYPDLVAQDLGYSYTDDPTQYLAGVSNTDLVRLGSFGATTIDALAAENQGYDSAGPWAPQFTEAARATSLVTATIGNNDTHFGDSAKSGPEFWFETWLTNEELHGPGGGYVAVRNEVDQLLNEDSSTPSTAPYVVQFGAECHKCGFDAMFSALSQAQSNGAKDIITQTYNPYAPTEASNQNLPQMLNCYPIYEGAQAVVDGLDDDILAPRSSGTGIALADLRKPFSGHGAGGSSPWVWGTHCDLAQAIADAFGAVATGVTDAYGADFDPHPNADGAYAIAQCIDEVYLQKPCN